MLEWRVPSEVMTLLITIADFVQKSVHSALHNTHSSPGNVVFIKHAVTLPSNLEKMFHEKEHDLIQLLAFVTRLNK